MNENLKLTIENESEQYIDLIIKLQETSLEKGKNQGKKLIELIELIKQNCNLIILLKLNTEITRSISDKKCYNLLITTIQERINNIIKEEQKNYIGKNNINKSLLSN